MSYRRSARSSQTARAFSVWVRTHQETLIACGLPQVAWTSQRTWLYFLENRSLPYELDGSGRDVIDGLTDEQAHRLHNFLAAHEPERSSAEFTLIRLRWRLGIQQD
jgi:hypothetical protein